MLIEVRTWELGLLGLKLIILRLSKFFNWKLNVIGLYYIINKLKSPSVDRNV